MGIRTFYARGQARWNCKKLTGTQSLRTLKPDAPFFACSSLVDQNAEESSSALSVVGSSAPDSCNRKVETAAEGNSPSGNGRSVVQKHFSACWTPHELIQFVPTKN